MELSEVKEMVANGKNEHDKAILETLEKTGFSKEEAIEIMAIYLHELLSTHLFSEETIRLIVSSGDKKGAVDKLDSILEDRNIDGINLLAKVADRYHINHLYNKRRKEIEDKYKETESWGAVYSGCVYKDELDANEAFIDLLEETYKTKITGAEQLKELTGIKTLNRYYTAQGERITYEEAEELDEKGGKPLMEESEEEAEKELGETLLQARLSKYSKALDTITRTGGKYADLQTEEPKSYGLPDQWDLPGTPAKDKQSSIRWAIKMNLLDHTNGLLSHPSLREIAKELEAPYSVVMEAHNLG
jgi:hypothetical protein